jgi:pimeloyl-ACP methyl ester carboxylesterase
VLPVAFVSLSNGTATGYDFELSYNFCDSAALRDGDVWSVAFRDTAGRPKVSVTRTVTYGEYYPYGKECDVTPCRRAIIDMVTSSPDGGRTKEQSTMESTFALDNFELQSGAVLPDARLVYETHGRLSEGRDNAIVYATWYAGRHMDVAPAIGEGRALDPAKYFIVVPNTFGNGLSSSPSNTTLAPGTAEFPLISTADNVRAQYRLLTEHLAVRRVALVVGYSMSGQQAFHWGAHYPDFVERIAPICASPKTTTHNWLFLEGLKAALQADPDWSARGALGIRAFSTVYAGWFASQAFYRQGLHLMSPAGPLQSMSATLRYC